ncbi:rifin [Plasmodium falciparum NF54]|uniref:Rifin n=2 Tax=Plasmodium falciparum TaxID=5833 RepID=Q8IM84_PLAF7|nr:rifin [Plasmodium falciparum 3D7]EWC86099.1 hypothetical protein PFNF54_04830 [Plasmodium falciparum NF54]KAF4329160.1 rifin [Plasmodium falciparum NF54]PKC49817.1 rifin [Plasmodium falciparum NF54]CZT99709.1 rifin [Plasmodium falciparum 3D7]|eukprot:XP_001348179.1 rifin [Plasmodium falciparum 3D7]
MKVHYINILLFAFPLNILVNTHKKPSITPHHTPKIPTTRLLCECELFEPANYDSDPQMRAVMDNFSKQTQQRFHEYDESLQSKRMQCKDKCDKEIQKIILKDKLEKQMKQELTTLETKITTDDIPTCICEKSVADKMEKGCLRCAGVFSGGVAPSVGLLGGIGVYGWKMGAPTVAMELAKQAGIEEGVKTVIAQIKGISIFNPYLESVECSKYITKLNYDNVSGLMKAVQAAIKSTGETCEANSGDIVCETIYNKVERFLPVVQAGKQATTTTTETVKNAALDTIESTATTCTTAITASIIAIVVIVLIMVIIYKILRYRRKKKMKKKLQYIKLLEE